MQFAGEVIVVGLMTALVGFIISSLMMVLLAKDFSVKKYHFWWQVLLSYFITGCLIHLLCEASGINHWYCANGVACRPSAA